MIQRKDLIDAEDPRIPIIWVETGSQMGSAEFDSAKRFLYLSSTVLYAVSAALARECHSLREHHLHGS